MPTPSNSVPTQRLPAPSLFVAPPSVNASNLDLSKSATKESVQSNSTKSNSNTIRFTPSAAIPGPTSPLPSPLQQGKQPGLRPPSPDKARRQQAHSDRKKDDEEGISHFPPPPPDARHLPQSQSDADDEQEQQRRQRRPTAVLDAHWAALQSTLSDIELSASGVSHVFGPNHASALDDLRKAQVELARAWGPRAGPDGTLQDGGLGRISLAGGKSSKDDGESSGKQGQGNGAGLTKTDTQAGESNASIAADTKPGTANTSSSNPHNDGRSNKSTPSQDKAKDTAHTRGVSVKEADADLDAAEQRRKESDAYFQKVKEGVADVVRKLDDVSRAMRHVEMESRDIWGDAGSVDSTELDDTSLTS